MLEQITVSVMITTYNLENYIAETLDSVFSQETDFEFEVLVGDDGSSDSTWDILKSYQEKNPRQMQIFQMTREKDISYNKVERSSNNRLHLWEHAKGKYACFLDGDDYYTDSKRLQKMVDILEKPENQDCCMCSHNLWMHFETIEDYPLCRAKKEQKLTLENYWKLMFLQANAILFRNNYAKKKPEKAVAANFDDNNITFWFFQFGKMYYLPECMGAYRQLENSSWNSNDEIKKNCSNMIGYSIEQLINPSAKYLSDIRHAKELQFLYEHREELDEDSCSPFYQTAKAQNLSVALKIYEMKKASDEELSVMKKNIVKANRMYQKAKIERGMKKLLKQY